MTDTDTTCPFMDAWPAIALGYKAIAVSYIGEAAGEDLTRTRFAAFAGTRAEVHGAYHDTLARFIDDYDLDRTIVLVRAHTSYDDAMANLPTMERDIEDACNGEPLFTPADAIYPKAGAWA